MKVLITGGTGFIGSDIAKYLSELGYEVVCFPREYFEAKEFGMLYEKPKPDVVVHAAWTRERDIQSLNHLDFARASCEFFDYCKDAGLRVINLGSHNEYGVKFEPAREDMMCQPVDTYGIAKLATTLYAQRLGFNTLRLFAVYGEGGRNFKSIYETSQKYSHPENVKDFVPLRMVSWAVERLMHAQHLYGEIINVASGTQETAFELVRNLCNESRSLRCGEAEICRECELMKRFNLYPQRQYEPSMWVGDTEKMERLLNLNPTQNYEDNTNSELSHR